MEFSNEYASVVVFGQAHLVENEDEKRRALQALLDKYFPDLRPGRDYRPMTEAELNATAVYAIEIETWSGKQKVAPR
jgi:nitroimidazol reductase NimA-like FMN-containing flavoprotein (pyridoxamine 5'-phosphate oxidase superfamily)